MVLTMYGNGRSTTSYRQFVIYRFLEHPVRTAPSGCAIINSVSFFDPVSMFEEDLRDLGGFDVFRPPLNTWAHERCLFFEFHSFYM